MDSFRDEDLLKQCYTVRIVDKALKIGGWVVNAYHRDPMASPCHVFPVKCHI